MQKKDNTMRPKRQRWKKSNIYGGPENVTVNLLVSSSVATAAVHNNNNKTEMKKKIANWKCWTAACCQQYDGTAIFLFTFRKVSLGS